MLQVVAVAWDAFSWVRTEGKRASWEETISGAVESVEKISAEHVAEFLRGEDAPITYLHDCLAEISTIRTDHESQRVLAQYDVSRAEKRLSTIAALLDSFDELGKEPVSL